ncbi:MAG TPA: tRNA pseudouridine(55) synthase TruB [Candidatus Peribacterales bacterium]|nr:tRNA pseudouridine(55) synthase TruB [Candidatus Peribacterales bacterium]
MRHGILLIDKPAGITSHDVVQKIRKLLGERDIGHLGTLDPAATGLLVLFVGKKALKVLELFQGAEKEYEAEILFGKVSTTYDRDGVIEESPKKAGWEEPSEAVLLKILREKFTGLINQRPPAHSALHLHGRRAYELMHENPDAIIDMPMRPVTISAIQLISYGYPHAKLRVACSSGTYIRSIAHDLGGFLRCGAYLEGLRRTRVGAWSLSDANTIEVAAWGQVIPLKEILSVFPRYDLSEEEWKDIEHGRSIAIDLTEEPLIAWFENLPVAIMERDERGAHPRKVF